jgi:heme/copper-type cytochrome/quinol oxidase subunit 2
MRHALPPEPAVSLASISPSQILILVIAGVALGILGAIIGTIASYRAAKGPRERTSVLRGTLLLLLVISVGVVAMIMTSGPLKFVVSAAYALTLAGTILYLVRAATRCRALDLEQHPPNQSTLTNAHTSGPTSSPTPHQH